MTALVVLTAANSGVATVLVKCRMALVYPFAIRDGEVNLITRLWTRAPGGEDLGVLLRRRRSVGGALRVGDDGARGTVPVEERS